jgi:hypothetical protein
MCNWFKKLFGGKKCCENCCHKEEKVQPTTEAKPEPSQPANVEKPQ